MKIPKGKPVIPPFNIKNLIDSTAQYLATSGK